LALNPNPVTGPVTIEILSSQDQDAVVFITDMTGRVVFERAVYLDEELTAYAMDFSWLPGGVYVVHVNGPKIDSSIRMVRVNP
jgi:hypothetical protein